ncbi:hypothetical protein AAFF_G00227400 [Aldrovandia affinis]|uniref:Uncharacterized protein n=1 Tax=Aldrovandia affinis TaxID=143900 RepID=A0AAD7X2C5_9TELE|nr:hypothetical protein AAFF_G00227400 [Aldrovandia affinis]
MLWDKVKRKLASLQRSECIRKCRKRKEKERANFFNNPFKYARQLLEDEKSGKLEVTKEKLEQHIRGQYSDPARNNPLGPPGHVSRPAPPTSQFNIMLPKFCQVTQSIQSLGGSTLQSSLTSRWGKPYRHNSQMVWQELTEANSLEILFGRNILQLPLQSINLGNKQGKTRLVQELRESTDQLVRCADAQVRTGWKWKAQVEVDQVISRLQHLEVFGRVQAGWTGLGWGEAPQFWSKANRKERKEMVVSEVTKMEEECLRHILSGCKTALSQGRYRWRHDQVLKKLAETLEVCRQATNSGCSPATKRHIQFVRQGGSAESTTSLRAPARLLSPGKEWSMRVDLGMQLQFPREITITTLLPDIVVWSTTAKTILLI